MFETTKLFSIPKQAAVPQQEADTITEKAGSDADTDSKKEIGTKIIIECSDSEYDEGGSDFEFAAQYCV